MENTARKHTYGHGCINTDCQRVGVGAMPLTSNKKKPAENRCFFLFCFFCVSFCVFVAVVVAAGRTSR